MNGHESNPIFAWLKAASGIPEDIPWNFSKFLVTCGDRVQRYSHEVSYGGSSWSRSVEHGGVGRRNLVFVQHMYVCIYILYDASSKKQEYWLSLGL